MQNDKASDIHAARGVLIREFALRRQGNNVVRNYLNALQRHRDGATRSVPNPDLESESVEPFLHRMSKRRKGLRAGLGTGGAGPWDVTALINAADPKANAPEQHLWVARLLEWIRQPSPSAEDSKEVDGANAAQAQSWPTRRVRHLLQVVEGNDELRSRVQGLLIGVFERLDWVSLLADLGFATRATLGGELTARLKMSLLPQTLDTRSGAQLFSLWFQPGDAAWLSEIDHPTLVRLGQILPVTGVDSALLRALVALASLVGAAGHGATLRERMAADLLAARPFEALLGDLTALRQAMADGGSASDVIPAANTLRARWDACRRAADSASDDFDGRGFELDVVHAQELVRARSQRAEWLINVLLAPDRPDEIRRLVVLLLGTLDERQRTLPMIALHYAQLARLVTERSAEAGHHYIARTRDDFVAMFRRALGGGVVVAGSTLLKFAIGALGLGLFWTGLWSGVLYAASFVLIMLLGGTLATKQPAMTAHALAELLPPGGGQMDGAQTQAFVDQAVALIRSQFAAALGNVSACVPAVLVLMALTTLGFGMDLVGPAKAGATVAGLSVWGASALFAAFTGVLLFVSSLFAGWADNWFVVNRIESALAWSPRIVAMWGPVRARRWSLWWSRHIAGIAGNVSLGLLLGLVPAILQFLGVEIDVRHVTLASGQLAAAVAALGWASVLTPAFVAAAMGIVAIGVLNLGVSFALAFRLALASRGIRIQERSQLWKALRARARTHTLSFIWPDKKSHPDISA